MRSPLLLLAIVFRLWLPFADAAPSAVPPPAAPALPPRIDVILWFDTEDYLLPADDDACLRLAKMLTERGIHATFKVVGEKARTLERRGRHDVIEALKQHTIGYHANFHSVHPTPSEYLADCGFLDGISEFVRREGPSAADVRRIFGVPTLACYGQPGSSWAPQAIAALGQIGVGSAVDHPDPKWVPSTVAGMAQIRFAPTVLPCYVDEGSHVGLDEKPFWYEGAINVYHMGRNVTRMDLHDPNAVEGAKAKVSEIAARLAADDGGGLISIFYHPCEWVHEQFWDGVNFAHGRNPPREEWKAPPQLPAEETEAAFGRFAQYLDHIRALPGVRFITAADLPAIYRDPTHTEGVTQAELDELAQRILGRGPDAKADAAPAVDFQVIGRKAFSAADQFELLAASVHRFIGGQAAAFPLIPHGLLGPDSAPPAPGAPLQVPWPAFRDSVADVADFLEKEGRLPARVFLGSETVPPADYLVALASVYARFRKDGAFPATVDLTRSTPVAPESHIAKDTPQLFGGWIIHPPGFRAPKIVEMGRLQAWTLKPALRAQ